MPLVAAYLRLKIKIQTLNLFPDIDKTEEEDLKSQRISTWLFLILLVLSIFSLLVYASLASVTKTVVIQQPTVAVYKDLQLKYPNTLVCPCQQILNQYSTFIVSFIPKFNQICSSDFISEQWLNYVNYRLLPQLEFHYVLDFRHSAYSFFQMLRTLCRLVSQTINDQLIQFYSTTLLTENLVSEETFLATTLASKDQFLNTTASSFQTSLNSLRVIIQGNSIVNRLETNYYVRTVKSAGSWFDVLSGNIYAPDRCSCAISSYCNSTTGIFTVSRNRYPSYDSPDYPVMPTTGFHYAHLLFNVPGINVGCFILDAVLQSDLSCLYNSSCLSQLNMYLIDSLNPFNATALNASYSSLPTVKNLVDKLMVDEWLFNSSYESYFSQCNSSTCTYTYAKQFDILFIITTVMGSIGGVVAILMLGTAPSVIFIRRFVCRRRRTTVAQTETDTVNSKSLGEHFQSCLSKIKDFATVFNTFKNPEKQSAHDLRNQRISTRLFIVLTIIALSVLVLYTSLTNITQTVIVKQPTVNVYIELQTKYSQTLVCPCTRIEISYEQFISFHPTFHQICSSDFITAKWTKYIQMITNYATYAYDFRFIGSIYFPTLLRFCSLSLETINNALLIFNSTKYVTNNVQQTDLFRSQTEQIVNLFKQTTINSYLQILSMGREMIFGNALFSGLITSYSFITVGDDSLDQVFIPISYNYKDSSHSSTGCSCKFDPSTCGQLASIYTSSFTDPILQFSVPGLWIGCYAIESLFRSTFQCYFNQSCIDKIYQLIVSTSPYPFNATAMIYNASSTQYNITTKIKEIIEHLMIEQWNDQISFQSYYEQCNPRFCVYTYNKQGDLVYVFTTTIGLIGGLTTILKIFIPPIVTFLRRKKRTQPIETAVDEHENVSSFVRKYIQRLNNYIITFNLFTNPNKRSADQVQYQRISTRVFIVLVSVSLIVLFAYVSFENVTQTMTVKNLSIDQFNLLYQQYRDKLQCPCKTLSIDYRHFIQFDPQFHAVCASDFVTSKTWLAIDYPGWTSNESGVPTFHINIDDFRQIASQLFQLLFSFCQLSMQTLNTELLTFNYTAFITPNLIPQQQFDAQTSQIIGQFIENTARSFLGTVWLVNNMTSANMLISALSSDSVLTRYPQYYYEIYNENSGNSYVYEAVYDRSDQQYNSNLTGINCDCQENPFCVQQAIVYHLDGSSVLFPILGIYVGCYLVEGLLRSDLRCFYDDLCLQQLMNSLQLSSNTSSLSNSSSVYQVTTTLLEIISNLMVEQWNIQTTYQDYFNQCQPDKCFVTYTRRGNIIHIITTMTGLIGGLTTVYMFVVPFLVKIIYPRIIRFKRNKRINNRVAPLEVRA